MRKKVAKTDFVESMLPKNRFFLFWDIYRNRLTTMFGIGALLLLFCIPDIVISCITNMKVYDINQRVLAELMTQEEGALEVFYLINSGNLARIPAFVIISLGLCGVAGVTRRLIWQDGVLFRSDFLQSIKENGLAFSITALILGVVNYLLQYCIRGAYFNDSTWQQVAIGTCIVVAFIAAFIAPMLLDQCTVYNLKFHKKASNAFLMSMRMPHLALALLVTNVAPYLLLMIDNRYTYIIFLILLPVLVMPAQLLINMLVCDNVLDKFINKQNYPQIYRKGMYTNADNKNG